MKMLAPRPGCKKRLVVSPSGGVVARAPQPPATGFRCLRHPLNARCLFYGRPVNHHAFLVARALHVEAFPAVGHVQRAASFGEKPRQKRPRQPINVE